MSEWISVEDRLPELWTPVLVLKYAELHAVCHLTDGRFFEETPWPHRKAVEITHWMPLPDPPEE